MDDQISDNSGLAIMSLVTAEYEAVDTLLGQNRDVVGFS